MTTYPRSTTNNAIHALSRRRSNRRPHSECGSVSSNPSMCNALFASMQSARASRFSRSWPKLDEGETILFSDRSSATVNAMAMYGHVSSSPRRSPGAIHGTFTIKAKTISTDRYRCVVTCFASHLQCRDNRVDNAAADGRKRAVAARIDVNKNADCARTKPAVCMSGSRPHRVCARF